MPLSWLPDGALSRLMAYRFLGSLPETTHGQMLKAGRGGVIAVWFLCDLMTGVCTELTDPPSLHLRHLFSRNSYLNMQDNN